MNKKLLAVLTTAALSGVSSGAWAIGSGLPFTVNEAGVTGIVAPQVKNVDSFDFSYNGRITQTNDLSGVGGNLDGDPFDEHGFLEVSSFKLGASTAGLALNAPAVFGGYGAYGIFKLTGTSTFNGVGITATFLTGSLKLYIDPNQDTTKALGATGAGTPTLGNIGDDLEIGEALLSAGGEAHLFAGLANGDFEVVWDDWALTPFGSTYFSAPSPFYMKINFDGNSTTVTPPGSLNAPFNSVSDGSGNGFFTADVPEPGLLALLGIGAIGLGLTRRRSLQA